MKFCGGVLAIGSGLALGNVTMLLPMLVACFAAMLVATLLRNAPIYDSLRERTLRGERVHQQQTEKK